MTKAGPCIVSTLVAALGVTVAYDAHALTGARAPEEAPPTFTTSMLLLAIPITR
jgi:hypothetical protein